MGRVKEFDGKIGAIILAFSLLVTIALSGCVVWLRISANHVETFGDVVYAIKPEEYIEILKGNGTITVDPTRLLGVAQYNNRYIHRILVDLIPIAIVFLLFFFILSVGLWQLLKITQERKMMNFVTQLNAIEDNTEITGDIALISAYKSIKQKFTDHLNDYKRLNSYLSHDQKNAITLLRTNLELQGNTEYIKMLDHISGGIDDILTLSENNPASLEQTVDVSLICAEICDRYRKVTDRIHFEFNEEDNTEILAKKHWIYRAVTNLVDNALKYGRGEPVTVRVEAKNNSVIITVKDNGIGIHKDLQETIFDHRYRINELHKDGYGIGLSLVAHVCDLCGGYVTLYSEIDKGTTVYLSFPQKSF